MMKMSLLRGLIVRNVELNPDGVDGDVVDNMIQYFLDFADDKRRQVKVEYEKLGLSINPIGIDSVSLMRESK